MPLIHVSHHWWLSHWWLYLVIHLQRFEIDITAGEYSMEVLTFNYITLNRKLSYPKGVYQTILLEGELILPSNNLIINGRVRCDLLSRPKGNIFISFISIFNRYSSGKYTRACKTFKDSFQSRYMREPNLTRTKSYEVYIVHILIDHMY